VVDYVVRWMAGMSKGAESDGADTSDKSDGSDGSGTAPR
jgi:hypothetical protein